VNLRGLVSGSLGEPQPRRTFVREYGRDSLLIWANLLLAPLFGLLRLRVGLQSEERLAATMEADATAMRQRGYLVASVQTFSLPVVGAPRHAANWYRVTYELQAAAEPAVDPLEEIR
jgi:hypothetical protein